MAERGGAAVAGEELGVRGRQPDDSSLCSPCLRESNPSPNPRLRYRHPRAILPSVSVEQIKQEVAKLGQEQLSRFSAWFDHFRSDAWDKQISSDAESGKFDAVFAEIDEELKRGEIRPL